MDPLTAALIGGGLGLSAGSLFGGSSSKKVKIPQEQYAAMRALLSLGKEEAPIQPLRQIAGLSGLEQFGQQLAAKYAASGEPEARQVAIQEALRTATTPVDITTLPEFRGAMGAISEEGSLEANRLLRSLGLAGMTASGPGRDILGRSVTGTQERMMAAAWPFAEAERQRRFGAIGELGGLAEAGERADISKIGVATDVGSLLRQIEQQINDAMLERQLRDIQFRYQTQPALLSGVMGGGVATVTGGEPSTFAQMSPVIGQILTALAMSGGQGGTQPGGFQMPVPLLASQLQQQPGW